MDKKGKIISHLREALLSLFSLYLLYVFAGIIIRIFQYVILYSTLHENINLFNLMANGLYHDLHKLAVISVFLFPIYALVYAFLPRTIYYSFKSIILIFLFLNLIAAQYFLYSFSPLDQIVYQYSINELLLISKASGDVSIAFYITLAAIIFLFIFLPQLPKKNKFIVAFAIIFLLLSVAFISKSQVKSKRYVSRLEYYIVKNNGIHFLEKSVHYFSIKHKHDKLSVSDKKERALKYSKIHSESEFINFDFPLLHKEQTKDFLGQYFNLNEKPPHIVLIIMESMCRGLSGKNARAGSFTPFIDSLSMNSLYWENFLSNAERTFGVLPNILGSLPFGERGFTYDEDFMPMHHSLIELLKKQGYYTAFYHGGWVHFNNMDVFCRSCGIDTIIDIKNKGFERTATLDGEFAWGYADHELYRQYFESQTNTNQKPQFNVLLTLSLHDPYQPPNQPKYEKVYHSVYNTLNDKQKKIAKSYKNILVTSAYTDDALRSFINTYKKRKDFDNTIFIITGDHTAAPFYNRTSLDLYYVPLVIYSPMLKKSQVFSSISSHLDIAPSLIAFLKENYNLKFPSVSHWIGSGLDSCTQFRNIHSIPFMLNSKEIVNYLHKNIFYDNGMLYRIDPYLVPTPITDGDSIKIIEDILTNFKEINEYTYSYDKIIDSTSMQME